MAGSIILIAGIGIFCNPSHRSISSWKYKSDKHHDQTRPVNNISEQTGSGSSLQINSKSPTISITLSSFAYLNISLLLLIDRFLDDNFKSNWKDCLLQSRQPKKISDGRKLFCYYFLLTLSIDIISSNWLYICRKRIPFSVVLKNCAPSWYSNRLFSNRTVRYSFNCA